MQHSSDVLEVRGLQLWRGDRHVLKGVSLSVAAGEVVHVSGPNGSGKTSLLRTLAGFLWPEDGEILWRGAPTVRDRDAFAAATAYLGHENGLKADLSVLENLHYLIRVRHEVGDGDIAAALEALGLRDQARLAVRRLSAGQRRRVALARVLLCPARLWLLDEPFTNLDAAAVEGVSGLIRAHVDAGGIALFTAHADLPLESRTRVLELR